jgi:hypothetical protein
MSIELLHHMKCFPSDLWTLQTGVKKYNGLYCFVKNTIQNLLYNTGIRRCSEVLFLTGKFEEFP